MIQAEGGHLPNWAPQASLSMRSYVRFTPTCLLRETRGCPFMQHKNKWTSEI